MGKKPAIPPSLPEQSEASRQTRDKILAAFSVLARRSGIRAVVMGELASQLRMSAMTLYKHFRSKDQLVSAMVDAWALEVAAIDALEWQKVDSCKSALEVLHAWANVWTASMTAVSPAFFEDLRRDYPEAWERFEGLIEDRKRASAVYLVPLLREDIHPGAALRILDKLVVLTADPLFAEEFGISRQEAVRTALLVWGGGALRQRTTLAAASPAAGLRASPRPAKKNASKSSAATPRKL